MKRFLAVLLALLIGIVPVGVMAEDENSIYIEMDFDSESQRDLSAFEFLYDTKAEFVNGLYGKGLAISNSKDLALARLDFGGEASGVITLSQAICLKNSKEAQIRVISGGKSLFAVVMSNKQIKAMGKRGYVNIRGYEENTWYNLEIAVNVRACTY